MLNIPYIVTIVVLFHIHIWLFAEIICAEISNASRECVIFMSGIVVVVVVVLHSHRVFVSTKCFESALIRPYVCIRLRVHSVVLTNILSYEQSQCNYISAVSIMFFLTLENNLKFNPLWKLAFHLKCSTKRRANDMMKARHTYLPCQIHFTTLQHDVCYFDKLLLQNTSLLFFLSLLCVTFFLVLLFILHAYTKLSIKLQYHIFNCQLKKHIDWTIDCALKSEYPQW